MLNEIFKKRKHDKKWNGIFTPEGFTHERPAPKRKAPTSRRSGYNHPPTKRPPPPPPAPPLRKVYP